MVALPFIYTEEYDAIVKKNKLPFSWKNARVYEKLDGTPIALFYFEDQVRQILITLTSSQWRVVTPEGFGDTLRVRRPIKKFQYNTWRTNEGDFFDPAQGDSLAAHINAVKKSDMHTLWEIQQWHNCFGKCGTSNNIHFH